MAAYVPPWARSGPLLQPAKRSPPASAPTRQSVSVDALPLFPSVPDDRKAGDVFSEKEEPSENHSAVHHSFKLDNAALVRAGVGAHLTDLLAKIDYTQLRNDLTRNRGICVFPEYQVRQSQRVVSGALETWDDGFFETLKKMVDAGVASETVQNVVKGLVDALQDERGVTLQGGPETAWGLVDQLSVRSEDEALQLSRRVAVRTGRETVAESVMRMALFATRVGACVPILNAQLESFGDFVTGAPPDLVVKLTLVLPGEESVFKNAWGRAEDKTAIFAAALRCVTLLSAVGIAHMDVYENAVFYSDRVQTVITGWQNCFPDAESRLCEIATLGMLLLQLDAEYSGDREVMKDGWARLLGLLEAAARDGRLKKRLSYFQAFEPAVKYKEALLTKRVVSKPAEKGPPKQPKQPTTPAAGGGPKPQETPPTAPPGGNLAPPPLPGGNLAPPPLPGAGGAPPPPPPLAPPGLVPRPAPPAPPIFGAVGAARKKRAKPLVPLGFLPLGTLTKATYWGRPPSNESVMLGKLGPENNPVWQRRVDLVYGPKKATEGDSPGSALKVPTGPQRDADAPNPFPDPKSRQQLDLGFKKMVKILGALNARIDLDAAGAYTADEVLTTMVKSIFEQFVLPDALGTDEVKIDAMGLVYEPALDNISFFYDWYQKVWVSEADVEADQQAKAPKGEQSQLVANTPVFSELEDYITSQQTTLRDLNLTPSEYFVSLLKRQDLQPEAIGQRRSFGTLFHMNLAVKLSSMSRDLASLSEAVMPIEEACRMIRQSVALRELLFAAKAFYEFYLFEPGESKESKAPAPKLNALVDGLLRSHSGANPDGMIYYIVDALNAQQVQTELATPAQAVARGLRADTRKPTLYLERVEEDLREFEEQFAGMEESSNALTEAWEASIPVVQKVKDELFRLKALVEEQRKCITELTADFGAATEQREVDTSPDEGKGKDPNVKKGQVWVFWHINRLLTQTLQTAEDLVKEQAFRRERALRESEKERKDRIVARLDDPNADQKEIADMQQRENDAEALRTPLRKNRLSLDAKQALANELLEKESPMLAILQKRRASIEPDDLDDKSDLSDIDDFEAWLGGLFAHGLSDAFVSEATGATLLGEDDERLGETAAQKHEKAFAAIVSSGLEGRLNALWAGAPDELRRELAAAQSPTVLTVLKALCIARLR